MDTKDTIEHRCETCFGTGQEIEVKPMKFGQWIAPPPACKACDGTGRDAKIS
ncbi:hypothetical protein [Bradyrhizobium sp. JYMT SZCCT0180]|uniref:hypothetical protein n=1 Tax=Bradyrhizobium sp. JYMT SZCCT0180 TaxID=2807666 RepID=UPI001BAA5BC8|nr:hypothetical protein [Bradyrhizobium sp. JYMT SZCCT0180]MBR1211266.1 hypothetical protein [Bradyrhizobium sp. JYMT SZCCT0180]